MPKGRSKFSAVNKHDPERSLGFNYSVCETGVFSGKQPRHIVAALGYAKAKHELLKHGENLSVNVRENLKIQIRTFGEELSEIVLQAVCDGKASVFCELEYLAGFIAFRMNTPGREGFNDVDTRRAQFIQYVLRNGYATGWRPSRREIAHELECNEDVAGRMAKELGMVFKDSHKGPDN